MARGVCREMDPEIFFPDRDNAGYLPDTSVAVGACGRCPVTQQCLTYALDREIGFGVWGGLLTRERRLLGRGRVISTWGGGKGLSEKRSGV